MTLAIKSLGLIEVICDNPYYIILFSVIQENGAKRLDLVREYNQHWTQSRLTGFFYLDANDKLVEWRAHCKEEWKYIVPNSVEEVLRNKVKNYFE